MRAKDFITERVLNLHTPEQKAKYINIITPILHTSYAAMGGYKNIEGEDELRAELEKIAQKPGIWKLVRKGGEIVSASIYKQTPLGRKTLATGAIKDWEKQGKAGVYQVKGEDVSMNRAYAEVSDKMEYIMINKFSAKPIPNKYASRILQKSVIPSEDGFHYTRDIGGHQHEKILVGRLDDAAWEWIQSQDDGDIKVVDKTA